MNELIFHNNTILMLLHTQMNVFTVEQGLSTLSTLNLSIISTLRFYIDISTSQMSRFKTSAQDVETFLHAEDYGKLRGT